ncbi:hypothetical protein [Demequina sp. NBRC 110052]|uniref:hypothetical protein n=1 Tax=Demequina sp. NBRC 110052 TaxID=1570341 RepID=UPI00117E3A34|nr:hypothetical protein [Demequina sp. NBRC 110052]
MTVLIIGVADAAYRQLSVGMIGLAVVTGLGPAGFFWGVLVGLAVALTVPVLVLWAVKAAHGWSRARHGDSGAEVSSGRGVQRAVALVAAWIHVHASVVFALIAAVPSEPAIPMRVRVVFAVLSLTSAATAWVAFYYVPPRRWDGVRVARR